MQETFDAIYILIELKIQKKLMWTLNGLWCQMTARESKSCFWPKSSVIARTLSIC